MQLSKSHSRHRAAQTFVSAALLLSVLLQSACSPSQERERAAQQIPSFVPANIHARESLPAHVRRVVALPPFVERSGSVELTLLDTVFPAELNKTLLFETASVSRLELQRQLGAQQFSSIAVIPSALLDFLRNEYGADAAVFTDITRYDPYRPISVGIRSKLVDLQNGEILWAFDTVFDSGDPRVAMAARRYQQISALGHFPLDNSETILQSPSRFTQYAAYSAYSTLPGLAPVSEVSSQP